jgi:hypothetical protein
LSEQSTDNAVNNIKTRIGVKQRKKRSSRHGECLVSLACTSNLSVALPLCRALFCISSRFPTMQPARSSNDLGAKVSPFPLPLSSASLLRDFYLSVPRKLSPSQVLDGQWSRFLKLFLDHASCHVVDDLCNSTVRGAHNQHRSEQSKCMALFFFTSPIFVT